MLIIRVSYRARGPFARPKYGLALAVGAANPSAGPLIGLSGAVPNDDSEAFTNNCSDKKTLHCVVKYVSIALNSPSVQTDPPGFGSIVSSNARPAAAAPKTLTNKHNQARNHVTCFQ